MQGRKQRGGCLLKPTTLTGFGIKQRLDRVTQKRRVLLPYRDALKLCDERTLPEHPPEDETVLQEIHSMTWQYNLRPTSLVSYMRQAFVGTEYDVGLRVTFDTNLRYRTGDLLLHSKNPGRFMLPPDRVIMEVKVNNVGIRLKGNSTLANIFGGGEEGPGGPAGGEEGMRPPPPEFADNRPPPSRGDRTLPIERSADSLLVRLSRPTGFADGLRRRQYQRAGRAPLCCRRTHR